MPKLITGVRITVQGVVARSLHALWYLDWQTGGSTVLEADANRTA